MTETSDKTDARPDIAAVTGQDDSLMRDLGRHAPLVAGVILAGGLSRRMGGGDKALKEIGGAPLLDHVITRLTPQVGALALNANGDPARFARYDLPVVPDTVSGFAGPLAGVLAGMRWAVRDTGARWIVTAAADTPFFPEDLVVRLVDAAGHHKSMIALAASGGKTHPVFGLWPVALADDLEDWLTKGETKKVLAWVDRHPRTDVNFRGPVIDGIEIDPFFNANTPEDLETAQVVFEGLREGTPS